MGRYYSGDIEGKFWFAVQDSDDADRFGYRGHDLVDEDGNATGYLGYSFTKRHLGAIRDGINLCLKELGEFKEPLDNFFNLHNFYNDEDIVKELGISKDRVRTLIENYARLNLGNKILECVEQNGACHFDAEL
jgi:hypothetical protein